MPASLIECNHLQACEKYFSELVSDNLLGDIEPHEGELDHLAALISRALKNSHLGLSSSLSVAVFLVWMGWLHYQEGNYWGPVYQKLELSQPQIGWQGILGDSFLQAIIKYNLTEFQGKQRYVSPILAHGYVPNWHLESYFEDVVMAIYKDREKPKMQVKREEIIHLISSWRSDFTGYEKYHNRIDKIELAEKKIDNIRTAWQYKGLLITLRELQKKVVDKVEVGELLAYPEELLDQLETEKAECKKQYDCLLKLVEEKNKNVMLLEKQKTALQLLEGEIKGSANQIIDGWNNSFTKPILNMPVKEISGLVKNIEASRRMFSGIIGWFLRIIAPARYRRFCEAQRQLWVYLDPVPFKTHFKILQILPNVLLKLQDLLKQYNASLSAMVEINLVYQETASMIEGMASEDLDTLKNKLDRLTQELAGHKTKLVRLGKGDLENGKELLAEQRELLKSIELLRGKIPGDAHALVTFLPMAEKYSDIKKIEHRLVGIRKKKNEARENLKIFKNPLYTLNESTRIFILQGGEKAIEFVFQSLLLINDLRNDKVGKGIILPDRIKRAMKYWWEQKGKSLLEITLNEIAWEKMVSDGIHICKPVVRFDPVHKEIKVTLPRQPVREKAVATFTIHGEAEQRQQKAFLPLMLEEGVYWSEAAEVRLERPEPSYHFQFSCGDADRSWQIKGIGLDSFCMLFNMQGELIGDNHLPENGIYLIAPAGSHVEPVETIKEQLSGYWSGYEYRLIDPENNDAIVVRTGENIFIYKRNVQVQPTLLSHGVLHGVTAKGARIYQGQLPSMMFSVSHPEEVKFYGLRLEDSSETLYKTLEELNASITKENVVNFSLDSLAKGQYGLYEVALIKRGNVVWSEKFAVVPDLAFIFDQSAYKVQDGSRETGRLEFSAKQKFEFIPESGTSTIRLLSPTSIEFETNQDIIQGCLVYHLERKLVVEISIDIPVIRWRQKDGEWKAEAEEVWHEDLGEIVVKVPANVGGSITLSLEGDKQMLNSAVRQGVAMLNLRRFSDTLRDCSDALQEIILSCDNPEIPSFPLLRVRTRWQAAKIRVIQSLQENSRHLAIEWEDRGRALNRMVRLWPLMPGIDLHERPIPDGANSLSITVPQELIPSGRYRLQLGMIDPWSSIDALMPEQDAENCIDIDIGTKEEYLESYLGKRLEVTALYHGGQIIKPGKYYWLEVIELNPTFEEEVRLVGNLYSFGDNGVAISMPYNPVSFYIDDYKMPFLIDKDGDGATYCCKCKVMFWEVAHKECGDAVFVPEKILVKVEE